MINGTLPGDTLITDYQSKQNDSAKTKIKESFIYIGNNAERVKNCISFFENAHIASTYELAKIYIEQEYKHNKSLPDFIIIDKTYEPLPLNKFVNWLHSNKWSFLVPVLYNDLALTKSELKELSISGIADDILNIETYCDQLTTKAKFLKKYKSNKEEESKVTPLPVERIHIGKRIFDMSISLILLTLLFPLMLLISLIIKIDSKGPALYRSKRAGKGFKIFDFYKFRTMVVDADSQIEKLASLNIYQDSKEKSAFFKIKNDPRITRIGSFLRNTSLDELPQLINVLKGDMSIVGNRPLPLYEAASLTSNENAERFLAPAGITGLWQVTRRGNENMSAEERIYLDITYARSLSFVTDFKILVHTPLALFQKTSV
ncbi:MAG: sugar transferase [Ferruginibacter sp.]